MSEIVDYLQHGAAKITPRLLAAVHKKLPFLKIEFSQINSPAHPHLVNQLEFLASVVEDFADGADTDIPYMAVAEATFALMYAHEELDLIPDDVPEFGHADDSSVVRAVLIKNERVLGDYANRHKIDWSTITDQA